MESGFVSIDAFQFLDVRAPRPDRDSRHQYVVDRRILGFPETSFETVLKGLAQAKPATYQVDQVAAASLPNLARNVMNLSGGYLDAVNEYEEILLSKQTSPEMVLAKFNAFLTAHKGAANDANYLITPASKAWDLYLASAILSIYGTVTDPTFLSTVSSALRIAAAIFALQKQADDPPNLAAFAVASIAIGTDLIDTNHIRSLKPIAPLPAGDTSARELQNSLLGKLLAAELALKELRRALIDGIAIIVAAPAPIAPVPAAPLPGGIAIVPAGDVAMSKTAKFDTATIPNTSLSPSTRALLVSDFSAVQGANNVENVDIVRTIAKLDQRVIDIGRTTFGLGSVDAIGTISSQMNILAEELARSGNIPTAKIATLPLALAPPNFARPGGIGSLAVNANVRPLGVGDLKTVKQNLLRYEAGEVGHVENVLQGQQKERLHSVKQKTEETITYEQEKSVSTEKDLQTTDRFEMKDESSSAISDKRQNEAGVTVSASYGAVSISANTKFSDSSSHEQSSKISRTFAREVVNRSVEKVQQRVREERIRKTTLEIEETNRHTLSAQNKNVVGVYRWIDKCYGAQVNVYGKRLMLEFLVPEPAALYLYSQTIKSTDPNAVLEPEPLIIKSNQITRSNYTGIASKYGAEVENPPPSIQLARFATRTNADTAKTALTLADGWIATYAGPGATWLGTAGSSLYVHIGDEIWDSNDANWPMRSLSYASSGEIPLMVTPFRATTYNVNATVVSVPSDFLFEQWQLSTYKAILEAYRLRVSEYQDYLRSRRPSETVMTLKPDKEARDIERRELQRASIEILTLQHFAGMGAVVNNPSTDWPEIDYAAARNQGDYALFFQQSFEWEQMTYVFYPYFWARQSEWKQKLSADGGDALFSRFLNAGFARVVLPVRPAHEGDVLYYLETGVRWGGTEPPILGEPKFVNIIDEIKESLDAPDSGVPDGDPWQFKIPTSLVILDENGKLPEWPVAFPASKVFVPSDETCSGVPYNAAQWPNAAPIADAIRKLGYAIPQTGDPEKHLKESKSILRAMQVRFNQLGAEPLLGRPLKIDGIVGPCTLRALTHFDAMRSAGSWPGV
ncbi:hypothetical protein [Mesorhizobium sp. M0571]|uniref:hypothetical protein n=1 Tax=Mesorhizobium sp. M0571 TaxID=2956960 RepID=UPI003334B4D0